MLETTRAASYIPGSNLRGRTAGPAWLFLLPSLAPERIVYLGAPAPQVLSALAQLGGRMTVLCAGAREERRVRGTCSRLGLENDVMLIEPLVEGRDLALPKSIIQRVIDRRRRNTQSRRRVAVDHHRGLQPAGLL